MLIIRQAQMDVFHRMMEEDFQRRVRLRIREAIPEIVMDDGQLEANAASAIRQARECGFMREVDIVRFVEILFLYFGGVPKAGLPKPVLPVLYSYRTDPELKLRRFEEWCRSCHPTGEPR
jgi:hypothetical protein